MNQVFTETGVCTNCLRKLSHRIGDIHEVGGIRHEKTTQGYKTGMLCRACSAYGGLGTMKLRSYQYTWLRRSMEKDEKFKKWYTGIENSTES